MVVQLLYQQSEIFPDRNHGGRTFYNEAVMSAMKIPQVIKDSFKIFLLKTNIHSQSIIFLCYSYVFCVMLNV